MRRSGHPSALVLACDGPRTRFLLDSFPGRPVRSIGDGGPVIPEVDQRSGASQEFDFDRLERAVVALVERQRRLLEQNASLLRSLEERDRRLADLDDQLEHARQLREDVGKRIDELIAQIDQLDAQLATLDE